MPSQKGVVILDPQDCVGIRWIQCSQCKGWDIYENTGIPGPYDAQATAKVKFTCRSCKIGLRIDNLCQELDKFNTRFPSAEVDTWKDVVKKLPIELKANRD